MYEILSLSFFYPRSKEFVQLRACLEIPKLKKSVYTLPDYYGLAQDFKGLRVEAYLTSELEEEYNRLFMQDHPCCPVLERDYGATNVVAITRAISDILSYYKEASLPLPSFLKEFPDHAIAELDLMRTLTAKEIDAESKGLPDEAEKYRAIQRKFLKDHLGKWFLGLCSTLSKAARVSLYADVARLGSLFVTGEMRFLEIAKSN